MARGEGVKRVADLFEVYRKRLRAPQKTVVQSFQEVVNDVCGIVLKKDTVSYATNSRTISLKVPGQIKTEIMFKKDEILVHLKGRLGPKNAPEHIV